MLTRCESVSWTQEWIIQEFINEFFRSILWTESINSLKRSSSKEWFIHNELFCSHKCATLQVFCPLEWGHSGAHLNVIHPLCVLAWACAHVCEYMCIYFPLWRLRKGSGGSASSLQLCPEICFKLSACCSCPVMLQALWKSYCLEQKNDWVPV